jgi:ABC-type sulfate/molybdate transport systems ATPase subunit
VVVSHDLDLVAITCERAILLDHGRVEADGPSDETIRRYRGQSEPVTPHRGIDLSVVGPTARASGATLVAELTSRGSATADVQFVIPSHNGLVSNHGPTVVCGEASASFDRGGRHRLSIPTAGLPPGRYELRVGLREEDASGDLVAQAVPFTLTGPAGPNAIRLESIVAVEPLERIAQPEAS